VDEQNGSLLFCLGAFPPEIGEPVMLQEGNDTNGSSDQTAGEASLPPCPASLSAQAAKPFFSMLSRGREAGERPETARAPEFFQDLNLDQIMAAITMGWQDYDLAASSS
jgi:hypothetical protein